MTDTQNSPAAEQEEAAPERAPLPWADVQVEHRKMLRLAPLQTDRATGARPLRFIEFGYAERSNKDYSLLRMVVSLPGQRVRKEQNHLDVWVEHETRRVFFEPESGLQIEPLNRGIGRFLLAQATQWAQKKWSHYRVDGFELANKDALNEDTRLRRDHVLRTLGLDVVYADAQHLKGSVKDIQVGELQSQWNTEKLQFVEILEAAQMLQQAEQNLEELEGKLRKQEEKVTKYKREDTGLRFTITCLVAFAVFQAGLLIWIATHR
ncbi:MULTISPECIES: hypothetical protein [Pseudomonas]|uniref:N-acetyltransferase n=1 Tax=Pseudomonas sessilinigenes TaxID=658629 RepID=A0ABX8MJ79_9PSED|nr:MULTISPECIES: hypothetical protein [Pseudomonas]AZC27918.1 hypothetical protein C4K39_6286 [Pseudomonas sessilinigenes]QIH10035.1 hypothetical protein ATY02_26600 [Pseudomonas sp. BIOMIG1BAC]QXH38214.1 hypothetical protein KSS89_18220 [Pseudomonas sessilinigenes]UMZ10297.1 hypothetical protein I9018_22770 [Pseudomonas sp. MPFS]